MSDRSSILSHVDTVVVKVGTSSITGGGNSVSEIFMDSVAKQVKELRDMGKKVLLNIDRVGRDMWMAPGMCGSVSGSVPTNVGQPRIRVSSITVGGKGGAL